MSSTRRRWRSNAILEGQGRADGARHDRGLPRRPRDAAPADPRALRHPVRRSRRRSSRAGAARGARAARPARRDVGRSSTRRASASRAWRSATQDVEAVAIALLHSYADDGHERRVERDRARDRRRGRLRDALVRDPARDPRVRANVDDRGERVRRPGDRALSGLARASGLRGAGIDAPARRSCSRAAASMPPTSASAKPAHLVESGPAAGVIACSPSAAAHGPPNADLARHGRHDGEGRARRGRLPARTTEYEVGARDQPVEQAREGRRLSDQAARSSTSSEIGAGGGSIVSVDRLGALRVGPRSAGAVPGPGVLRHGGTEPTLTDALARARVPQRRRSSAAARSRSTRERAQRRSTGRWRRRSARPVEEVAYGILQLAVATMTRAVKAVTTYRGRDPRDFTLCAFGGNGPLTRRRVRARARRSAACSSRPRPASSAPWGCSSRTPSTSSCDADAARRDEITRRLGSAFAELEAEARAHRRPGRRAVAATRFADAPLCRPGLRAARARGRGRDRRRRARGRLRRRARRTYGHGSVADPVDIVSIRALARVERTAGERYEPLAAIAAHAAPRARSRKAYFGAAAGLIETPVRSRAALLAGAAAGAADHRRVRLDLRRPAGLRARASTTTATSRSSSETMAARSTRSRSRSSRTRSRRPPTRWRSS